MSRTDEMSKEYWARLTEVRPSRIEFERCNYCGQFISQDSDQPACPACKEELGWLE